MGQPKPRLMIIDGPCTRDDALAARLSDRFEVVLTPPDRVGDTLRQEPVDAVLAAADRLPMMWAELGQEQAMVLLDAMGEGVCLARRSGQILFSNRFFSQIDEPTQQRVGSLCNEAAVWFADRRRDAGSAVRQFELASDDGERFYEVTITPVRSSDDGAERPCEGVAGAGQVAAVVRDVSETHRWRRKLDTIDRAGHELMSIDADEIRKLNMVDRLRLLERKIVKFTSEILHFDHFAIFLVDDDANKLELVFSVGLPTEIEDLTLRMESEGSGISGFVASTGQSYICHDAGSDDRFLPGLSGAQSSLTVPLRLHDQLIGIMDIESRTAHAFSERDRQFAEIFGRYVAVALHTLDLMVVERSTTNETVSGRFEGEINEPLDDIAHQIEALRAAAQHDPELRTHVAKIQQDVESIRARMKDVREGPQTLLGVEKELADQRRDPFLTGRRVLVADDQPKIRRILSDVLTNRGCEVVVCRHGGEAIEALEAIADGRQAPFDLVLSDIKMPDHNGYEVFAAARRHMPGVPVILMTGFGYDPHHSIVRASQEGLQAVLFKPFQIDQLIEQVRQAVCPEPAEH